MKCLVTGGNGFIGGHLVDELEKSGHDVVVVDNMSAESNTFWHNISSRVQYHLADICDFDRMESLFKLEKFDFVFLLDVLEHLEDDAGALNSLHCLLRPLGMLVIEVPIFETSSKQSLLRAPYLYPQHHLHLYSREGFVDMAKNQCWEVLFSATTRQEKKAMYVLGSKYGKNSR